jgi:hypothetical protein
MNKTPQSVRDAKSKVFHKMYVANVRNRLRELNEPKDNDCKRWIWELIQNAKDSISKDTNRKTVDIKITVRDKEVKFLHNGSPFTAKAQLGLLYKYSEGKVNNSESTGRFGTGFLTTHTLSKIVSIEGDVYVDDNNSNLCGFSATMYRDGIDEPELLDGVKKMKESMVYTEETNDWTTYTYHLKIEKDSTLDKLKEFLSESGTEYDDGYTIIFLNDFYDYQNSTRRIISGNIVPNQNGKFCSLEDLFKDDNIPEALKNILYLVNPEEDYRNLLADTSIAIQPTHSKKLEDIAQILDYR